MNMSISSRCLSAKSCSKLCRTAMSFLPSKRWPSSTSVHEGPGWEDHWRRDWRRPTHPRFLDSSSLELPKDLRYPSTKLVLALTPYIRAGATMNAAKKPSQYLKQCLGDHFFLSDHTIDEGAEASPCDLPEDGRPFTPIRLPR